MYFGQVKDYQEPTSEDTQVIRDGIQNLMNNLGSNLDPNVSTRFVENCGASDLPSEYSNGGAIDAIVNFWPGKMATGIDIAVAPDIKSRRKIAEGKKPKTSVAADELAEWIEDELEKIRMLETLELAEAQCHIYPGAPILIKHSDWQINPMAEYVNVDRISSLRVLNPLDVRYDMASGSRYPVDHGEVNSYSLVCSDWQVSAHGLSYLPRRMILPMCGKPLLPAGTLSAALPEYLTWGRPLLGENVARSLKQLEIAISTSVILTVKKSHMDVGLKDLFTKLTGKDSQQHAKYLGDVLQVLHKFSNVMGINLSDIDEMETKIIERSLTGLEEVITELRRNLLMHCPEIPEEYLFGRKDSGSLSSQSGQVSEQIVDSIAAKMFNRRWKPLIMELVGHMLQTESCPHRGYNLQLISVERKSCYSPREIEAANARKANAQADRLEMENESIRLKIEE